MKILKIQSIQKKITPEKVIAKSKLKNLKGGGGGIVEEDAEGF